MPNESNDAVVSSLLVVAAFDLVLYPQFTVLLNPHQAILKPDRTTQFDQSCAGGEIAPETFRIVGLLLLNLTE
jgi:hypothetical protein